MKRITLPKIALTLPVEEPDPTNPDKTIIRQVPVGAVRLLTMAAYDPGERGLTIAEQRKRIPLWEKLEAVKDGILLLEDAEWETLKPLMEAHRFPWTHRDVTRVGDAVEQAEDVPLEDVGLNRETRRRVAKKGKAT